MVEWQVKESKPERDGATSGQGRAEADGRKEPLPKIRIGACSCRSTCRRLIVDSPQQLEVHNIQ